MMMGWAILTIIPAILLISDTALFPLLPLNSLSAEGLFWLTSSGTAPYGVATVLFILLLSYHRLAKAEFISLFLTISLGMCTTLGLNHYLKPFFNEARPNAVWLEQQYLLNTENFYTLTKAERKAQMTASLERLEHAETDLVLSPLVKQHWKNEVGFAFPSGHTLFAMTLTMIASYYLLLAGNLVLPTILFIWSITMGFSRMLLGMHWSQDVLASTVLGGVISLFSLFFIHKTFPYGAKAYTDLSTKLRQKRLTLKP
ncbi:phosphatase PAP2 family protein [Shewanella canadensis]|uniref:undecaprenyl-diphosphate phosphatase n=2 Tax=Shewanella canadensis TaxID=271096 RepID=A0A3S0IM01_9GAMM|nr:phosphatase PAP2 family protein [Shewanella canadensis]